MAIDATIRFLRDKLNLNKFRKLYYIENDGTKYSLDIGAFEEQSFAFSNTISDNPVEFGANLSDNIYRNPVSIKAVVITGETGFIASVIDQVKEFRADFLTGTDFQGSVQAALQSLGLDLIDGSSAGTIRSSKVYNKLIDLHQNFKQVEIITRDRVYKNLQIESINRTMAVDNYGGAVIELNLKELLRFGGNDNNLLGSDPRQNGFLGKEELQGKLDDVLGRFGI